MIEKSMNAETIMSKLLFVPFSEDCKIEQEIKDILTENRFFDEDSGCFIPPDFEAQQVELFNQNNSSCHNFLWDISVKETSKRLTEKINTREAFYNWINSGQRFLYGMVGDAGTGKSTYVHYLKYKFSQKKWDILDVQETTDEVSFLGHRVKIHNFHTLYSKAISAMLSNISNTIFPKNVENAVEQSLKNIICFVERFTKLEEENYYPIEIENIFQQIADILNDQDMDRLDTIRLKKDFCNSIAENFVQQLQKILEQKKDSKSIFRDVFRLFVHFIYFWDNSIYHVIAIDNIETMIGTDEIHNGQITEFVSAFRNIQGAVAGNNEDINRKYRLLLIMRHTTLRMLSPLQAAEFREHSIDLSDWFDAGQIIQKKIRWYRKNNIVIPDLENLSDVFSDMTVHDNIYRGLYYKISMLFNYNKRIIIEFLSNIFSNVLYEKYIALYNIFWKKNDAAIQPSTSTFAARSIMYRLVLDELRQDGFFKQISVQRNIGRRSSLSYARMILTVLHEHKLTLLADADQYLPLSLLIEKCYGDSENPKEEFLRDESHRDQIIQVLFWMNYYNSRRNNWLQFIDIQYDIDQSNNVFAGREERLKELIIDHFDNISLRITTAGCAYLYFIVYYFEYFACKSYNTETRKMEFDNNDIPPLLTTIPSADELRSLSDSNIGKMICVKCMKVVAFEAINCMAVMQDNARSERAFSTLFRRNLDEPGISHSQSIVRSQCGYLDNFFGCVKSKYSYEAQYDMDLDNGIQILRKTISKIKKAYHDTENWEKFAGEQSSSKDNAERYKIFKKYLGI